MAIHPPISASTLRTLGTVSTATLTTQLMARGLRNTYLAGLAPLNPGRSRQVGEAITLRCIPSRDEIDELSVFHDYDHPKRKTVESVP
ncbi:MAG: hypothetical protein QOD04_2664, partial [Pseudonocardiales bacterium]|nr:hypothetical protein [Pseudonocardiales bacterium]